MLHETPLSDRTIYLETSETMYHAYIDTYLTIYFRIQQYNVTFCGRPRLLLPLYLTLLMVYYQTTNGWYENRTFIRLLIKNGTLYVSHIFAMSSIRRLTIRLTRLSFYGWIYYEYLHIIYILGCVTYCVHNG